MKKKFLSFGDAAAELEALCEQVNDLEEIGELVRNLFATKKDEFADAVDRRIKWVKYAESQIATAKEMKDLWDKRLKRFERTAEYIKQSTISTIKANPDLPYKGSLGGFHLFKNSKAALKLHFPVEKKVLDVVAGEVLSLPDEYFEEITVKVVKKEKLREALEQGLQVVDASLDQGEHVRINLNI